MIGGEREGCHHARGASEGEKESCGSCGVKCEVVLRSGVKKVFEGIPVHSRHKGERMTRENKLGVVSKAVDDAV